MTEAVRALILDGHLVDIGDVVLHDAGMDVRSPTHELTRAATALRARRTVMARKAPWPLSIDGLAALRGIMPANGEGRAQSSPSLGKTIGMTKMKTFPGVRHRCRSLEGAVCRYRRLARPHQQGAGRRNADPQALARIWSTILKSMRARTRTCWLDVVKRTAHWPTVAAAAIAWNAWLDLNLYPRQPWLGLIMAGMHPAGPRPDQPPAAAGVRIPDLEVPAAGQGKGRREGRGLLHNCRGGGRPRAKGSRASDPGARDDGRVTRTCRSNSKLPELVNLFLSRPLVTVALGAKLFTSRPRQST